MKFDIQIHAPAGGRNHQIELAARDEASSGRVKFLLDGSPFEAECAEIAPGVYSILVEGRSYEVHVAASPAEDSPGTTECAAAVGTETYHLRLRDARVRRSALAAGVSEGPQVILAPMPGKIVRVLVEEGQSVEPGQELLIIEAMKMQNQLRAPRAGRVEKIHVREGAGVETGARLVRLA